MKIGPSNSLEYDAPLPGWPPSSEQVRGFMWGHDEVSDGVELFYLIQAPKERGARVTVPLPMAFGEMVKEPQLSMVEPPRTVELEPMVGDRHGGWLLAYAWSLEHRVAVYWIYEERGELG